jgi:hypothetical protein
MVGRTRRNLVQNRYSQTAFTTCDLIIKTIPNICLLREIHIIILTIATADMRPARLAIGLFFVGIDTNYERDLPRPIVNHRF